MRIKSLVIVCFLSCTLLFGKDKSLDDYSISFTVVRANFGGNINHRCDMFLKASNGTNYYVHSNGTCVTFNPGFIASGRLTKFWGMPLIELAWRDKGKVRTCKYNIDSASMR